MTAVREITPKSSISLRDIKDIWLHRELIYFLSWRDFKVRYKQTIIGAGWAIFQPLIAMLLVTFAFKDKLIVPGVPYPVFATIGFVFWFFFSNTLVKVSNSLTVNAGIITKVYFPRMIIPISGVFVGIIDFAFGSVLLAGVLWYHHISLTFVGVIVYVLMALATYVTVMGFGFVTSVLNARFRDVQFILPFLVQILLFATPVFYLTPYLTSSWVVWIHPMLRILDVARATIVSPESITLSGTLAAFVPVVLVFVIGYIVFAKVDAKITDVI